MMRRCLLAGSFTLVASGAWAQPSGGYGPGPLPIITARIPPVASVLENGAKCDGVTDDSAAFTAAAAAALAGGGGIVWVPSTGHACLLNSGVSLGNSVILAGAGAMRFAGVTATIAQWTASGSWLQCADTVNPCVTVTGHGAGVHGLNFIYAQPVPSGTFTPTVFPYAILDKANFSHIEHVNVIAGTHGISVSYPLANGGGAGTVIRDILLATFNVGMNFDGVNDNISVENIDVRNMYYSSTASVVTYTEANLVGMDIHYLDNPRISNYQCLFCAVSMQFTNSTVLGNTHSMYNAQLTNIQHNLVRAAMKVAATNTVVTGHITNTLTQSDGGNSLSDTLYQLGSDGVDLQFHGLNVNVAGGSVMALGGGTGGSVLIDGYRGLGYSQVTGGQTGFVINAGARLTWGSRSSIKTAGSGTFHAGANSNLGVAGPAPFAYAAVTGQNPVNITGTGAFVGLGSAAFVSPQLFSAAQGRIVSSPNVTTAQAAGTFTVRFINFPEATATASCAATGVQSLDSGWTDLTSATTANLGGLQVSASSGCVISFGDVTAALR